MVRFRMTLSGIVGAVLFDAKNYYVSRKQTPHIPFDWRLAASAVIIGGLGGLALDLGLVGVQDLKSIL